MEKNESLTTEAVKIKKLPLSQFELVNYAINIVRHKIEAGIGLESQNVASEVLLDILHGKDMLNPIAQKNEIKEAISYDSFESPEDVSTEKKRARKVAAE